MADSDPGAPSPPASAISRRAAPGSSINEIARARAELVAAGVAVLDLSDSNPTRHGLLHPGVLDILARHVPDAARYRPHPRGPLPARQALAGFYGGDPDDYWLTASTSEAYSWLLTLLADPGESVAIPAPGYPLVEPLARLAGVRTAGYRTHYVHPHGWILDAASLAACVADPAIRAVIAVNPGNPTGAYLGDGAAALLAACARRRLPLICDEVFAPFALDAAGASLGGENTVVAFALGGLSKLLCAPQLKLAWIRMSGPAADLAPLRDGLDTIADTYLSVNSPVAHALPDLLGIVDESVAGVRDRLRRNLDAARTLLADGPFRVRRCEGGWTMLLDVPRQLPSGEVPLEDLALRLLRRAHLAAHPGWFYDLSSATALAISLLPEPARFTDGLRRLRDAVEQFAGEREG